MTSVETVEWRKEQAGPLKQRPSLSCFMQNVRPTFRVGCRAHLLASWRQIVSLRIYYRANGTLLRRVHGMYVSAQALS